MRTIKDVTLSPLGIATAAVHWLVATFALLGDQPAPGFNQTTRLLQYLVVMDLPGLLPAYLLLRTATYLFPTTALMTVYVIAIVIFVSLQWFLIGWALERILAKYRSPCRLSIAANHLEKSDRSS